MKTIFLLDTNEYLEVAPERLQLRQITPDTAALGTEVEVPMRDAEGKVLFEDAPEGTIAKMKTQQGFIPLINYRLVIQAVPEPAPAAPETVVIHKEGKTRVTDSNDPEAKLLAAGGTGRKVRKVKA